MGQGMSIPADARLVTFNTLALQTQDEAYTLAYYLLGDERRAEKATQAAFDHLYRHTRLQSDSFRQEALRRVLANCRGWFASAPGNAPGRAQKPTERKDDLSWKLLGLEENERAVLILVDVLGLDYEEAAQVLGGSKKQVSKLLAQARLNLSREAALVQ